MKKKIIAGSILLAIIIAIVYFANRSKKDTGEIIVQVKKGDFIVNVATTGELVALKSTPIKGPEGLREFRIFDLKISDIIADGSVVKKGDYIATLDKTDITTRIKDNELDLDKLESQLITTRLDTALTMRGAREELINFQFDVEGKKITCDQSIYEPPASQRQAKIELERSIRTYEQAGRNFKLKLAKSNANMADIQRAYNLSKGHYDKMTQLINDFIVKAPQDGMVVQKRNWDGSKQGIGTTMSGWDNVVAEMPELKEMISKTYVNEIDVSKVKVGQKAEIRVDAFPDKRFGGIVQSVANVGERMRNSNAKVFEVNIRATSMDSLLRPAMTTQNIITTWTKKNVRFIPIESVHSINGISYVFRGNKTRQEVKLGQSNDNEIIVLDGLFDNDKVYLNPPEKAEEWKLVRLTKS
jgi:multidrug efflux pump subunit AcrA (membrane-fusion protein)